jgi:hypothetical protein
MLQRRNLCRKCWVNTVSSARRRRDHRVLLTGSAVDADVFLHPENRVSLLHQGQFGIALAQGSAGRAGRRDDDRVDYRSLREHRLVAVR